MTHYGASARLDELDNFLLNIAFEVARRAKDVEGALLILTHFAEGDDCGLTPSDLMAALACRAPDYMVGMAALDRAGIAVPGGWRLA